MQQDTPDVQELLRQEFLKLDVKFTVKGFKSSEGDGRTAADIERERAEKESK